ncbi:MAG TPA: DUF2306 domain-containing protein [Ohtaekwangia sp.]
MKFEQILSLLLAVFFWVPVIFFSLLLSHNAILYFTHGGEYGILPEKLMARQDILWNISFYVHLPTGILCLLSPVILFSRLFIKKGIQLHRLIGKIYVWVTLILVCPTGMYLALYAKGGLITQTGFMLQGVLLGWFTYKGYQAIAGKNKTEHVRYMIRSYAVATVVLTFRIYHILFFLWKVPYQDNYAISQWLGLAGNLLLAEVIILLMSYKINSSQHLKSKII